MNLLSLNLLLNNQFVNIAVQVGAVLLALALLMVMITIHELGHYTAGKLLGFKINEFAVGFGKAIFSRTKANGEKFSLRVVPLGGYCAFEGEDEAGNESPQAFNSQAPWKRIVVLLSGVVFNFISAIIFSVVLIAVVGDGSQVITNVSGQNANHIQAGDQIVSVNGQKLKYLNGGFSGLTQNFGVGEPVEVVVLRDGQKETVFIERYDVTVTHPETNELIEVQIFDVGLQYRDFNFGESLLRAVPFSFEIAGDFIVIFGQLITGQMSMQSIGGPITTISVMSAASAVSLLNVLLLLPIISINLAIFNLLPIPALDGARIIFVLIEWVRGKPINREIEGRIHLIGLLLLFAFVLFADVLQLFVF